MDKIQYVGFLLAVIFGLFTVGSLMISITVLQSLRELIPDYTHAGEAFEKVINSARHTLFILTENPAFLQVLDKKSLFKWLNIMEKSIQNKQIKVIFVYINRQDLIGKKFSSWANAIRGENEDEKLKTLKDELLTSYTFKTAKDTNYREFISLIPLKTTSLPFYIAIADGDKIAMFCHSIIYPTLQNNAINDVRQSVLRGFLTYDQNIVLALKSVFLKFFQLNAAVYEYTCNSCHNKSYKFDHDLLSDALNRDNLDTIPKIKCDKSPECSGVMTGELKELIFLDANVRNSLYKQIIGEEWQD
jgi:hypothetical protein